MRLHEIVFTDAKPIDGYGPGFFRIGGQVIRGAVVVGPKGTQSWGGFDDIEVLLGLADQIDVLFVGTGADITHLPDELTEALTEAGIAAEPMSSPAACRTYNVLLSEGRRIALAVMPI
ncbi:MAG: Mth938-like domain-containing protein [Sulfitobacter sp.]